MKLYIANGQYYGTQAEAKTANKAFDQVEVPTDKPGLIDYLNANVAAQEPADEYETVVVRQDPPAQPSYTAQSIAIDEVWETLPLARKLHFAGLAVEDARAATPVLNPPEEEDADYDPFA